jgi:hypothetical protein
MELGESESFQMWWAEKFILYSLRGNGQIAPVCVITSHVELLLVKSQQLDLRSNI